MKQALFDAGNIVEKSEAQFLLNFPQLMLCEISADGTIVNISDALWALLKSNTMPEMQEHIIYDFLQKDDAANAQALIEIMIANNESHISFKARLLEKPATVLQFTGRLQNDTCYLVAQDISQTHFDEQIREQIEKLTNKATGISLIGHWYFRISENKLVWSDEVFTLHGVSRNEYHPELASALNFYHTEDLALAKNSINQVMQTGREWQGRLRIVRPDGEVRNVIVASNAIADNQGNVSAIFGLIQDVTKAEQLNHERNVMASAFESTHLGLIVTDAKRRVLYANQGFEELTGFATSEIKGQSLRPFLQGKKTDQKTVQEIRDALNNGKEVDCTLLNYTKDKTPYWNHLVITPIFRDGKLVNFVGVQQDVTEAVRTKNEIDELNNSLEHIVAERTEKLQEANEKLKRISIEDPLTGALNRRAFYQSYNTELKRTGRSGQPLSMALMDLDHFKKINDRYGHLFGDKVLKHVVDIINNNMRETDYLFRMGGEEFLLLMSTTGIVQAKIVCERIRKSIADSHVYDGAERIAVTLSIGLISHHGDISVTDALKIADESMYLAKQKGRNNVVCGTI